MAEAHQSVGVLREEISSLVASLQQSNNRALEAETDNFNRVPALLRKMTWRKSPRRPSPIPPPSLLNEYGATSDFRSSPLSSTSPTGAEATTAAAAAASDIELALRMREIQVDELQRRLALLESEWQNERLSLEQHAAMLKSDLEIKTGDLLSKLELACQELEDARQSETFLNASNNRQTKKIEEFEAANNELKTLLDFSTRNEAEYSMQLVEAQTSIHTLRGQRDAATREVEALKQQNSALLSQLNQLAETSKYTTDTQTVIRQLQQTTEEMLVARADAKRMNAVVSEKSAAISRLEEENAKLRSTASRLQYLSDASRTAMYQRESGDEETPSFERIRVQQRMVGRQTNTTPGAGMTPGGEFRARVAPRRGSITSGTPGTGPTEDKHRSRSTEPVTRQLARSKAPVVQFLVADNGEPQQTLAEWHAGMASPSKSLGGTVRIPRVTLARLGLAALLTRMLNRTVQKQQCWSRWRQEVLINRCQVEEINHDRSLQLLESSQRKTQELHAALTNSVAALQSSQTTSAGMVKAAKQELASLKSSYHALLQSVSSPMSSSTPATILAQPPQPVQYIAPTTIRLVDRKSSVEPITLPTPVARPSITTTVPSAAPTPQANTALSTGKSQLAAALAAMDTSISQFRVGTPSKPSSQSGADTPIYSVQQQQARIFTPGMHTSSIRGEMTSDWPPHPDT